MLSDVRICPQIAYNKIGQSYFVLNRSGELISLEKLGSYIWEGFIEGLTVGAIKDALCQKYITVDKAVIEKDVDYFLDTLCAKDIIQGNDERRFTETPYIVPAKYNTMWETAAANEVPLKVDIEVTNKCNHRCKYCYVELQEIEKAEYLPKQVLTKLIDELKDKGTMFLTITGGEPTLHPDIMEIIEYAVSKKFYVRLLTNGTLLDENKLQKLSKISQKGLFALNLSLHSLEKAKFEDFTQCSGTYDELLKTIKNIKKYDLSCALMCNLTKDNFVEIETIKKFATENGCYCIFNPVIYPTVHGNNTSEYLIDDSHIKLLIERNIYDPKRIVCYATKAKCWIDYRGDVNICEFIRVSAGNIKNSAFNGIWNEVLHNEEYKKLLIIDEECSSCLKSDNCPICPGLLALNNNRKTFFCTAAALAYNAGGNNGTEVRIIA